MLQDDLVPSLHDRLRTFLDSTGTRPKADRHRVADLFGTLSATFRVAALCDDGYAPLGAPVDQLLVLLRSLCAWEQLRVWVIVEKDDGHISQAIDQTTVIAEPLFVGLLGRHFHDLGSGDLVPLLHGLLRLLCRLHVLCSSELTLYTADGLHKFHPEQGCQFVSSGERNPLLPIDESTEHTLGDSNLLGQVVARYARPIDRKLQRLKER